jgi:colicin import membrane protein
MSEQKESSVLFSLKELMNLEEDRIKQEETARQRQAEAATQARLEAERRAREEEEARINAEEQRRRSEEQRAREDAARLEAIRHAEIEKARLDAENAARTEQLKHQQEHERQIKALSQDKHKKRLTLIVTLSLVGLAVALVGGGLFIKSQADERAAETMKHQQEMAAQQAQYEKLQSQLQGQMDQVAQLESAVTNARDDAARAAAQQKLLEAKNQAAVTQNALSHATPHGGGGGPATSKPKAPCNCPAGDPLCSCIP